MREMRSIYMKHIKEENVLSKGKNNEIALHKFFANYDTSVKQSEQNMKLSNK